MKIDPLLIQKVLGVAGVAVAGGYKTEEGFAEALERLSAEARQAHARSVAQGGILPSASQESQG